MTTKATRILQFLMGRDVKKITECDSRMTTVSFPSVDDTDPYREIRYSTNDGLILYFIKRIEKLEAEVRTLSSKIKK